MKLIPIITTNNAHLFVSSMKVKVAGTELSTAPLANDVTVDLIALSSNGWAANGNVHDMRAGLDPVDLGVRSIALKHRLSDHRLDVVLDKPLLAIPTASGDQQYRALSGTVQLITTDIRAVHVAVTGIINLETAECRVSLKPVHANMLQDPLNHQVTCGELMGWVPIGYSLNVNFSKEYEPT